MPDSRRGGHCYYEQGLADRLGPWIYHETAEPFLMETLDKILEAQPDHESCQDDKHCDFSERLCTALTKDFMTCVRAHTADSQDPSNLIQYLVNGTGCKTLQCLLKLGTQTLGCVEDLFYLLSYLIKLQYSDNIKLGDAVNYNKVCVVCTQLLADICVGESRNGRTKLAQESLPVFNAFTTNLLWARSDVSKDNRDSLDTLMLHSVQSYCQCGLLIRSTKDIEESSLLMITAEVTTVYHELSEDNSGPLTLSVVSACLVGIQKVLQSLLYKLHSFNHTLLLSVESLQLIQRILPIHVTRLATAGHDKPGDTDDMLSQVISACVAVVRQMKETKVKHIHNMKCHKKKHRHCDFTENIHHHHEVLSIHLEQTGRLCAVAYLTKLLLDVFKDLPHSSNKMIMLDQVKVRCGCCCMVQSDFITPLTTGVSERSEQDQHTIISSLTSILVDQLAGGVTASMPDCISCSQRSEDSGDVELLFLLLTASTSTETCRRVLLQHLYSMSLQCNNLLVFLLYRHVFKPTLDHFYEKPNEVGEDLVRLCLSSLTHSLKQDGCIDHFLSSTYSMQMLQKCVNQHNTLLPIILQIFSLLMQLRPEEQVLTPLLSLLLGEPEVQTTTTDFIIIELVYQTPDFCEPLSDMHMFLTKEKWSCCHKLLNQSILFRLGFESQNGVQLLLMMTKSLISALIGDNEMAEGQRVFLTDLLKTVISCLLVSIHHTLSINKTLRGNVQSCLLFAFEQVLKIERLCSEINAVFHSFDTSSTEQLNVEKSFHLLGVLLDCASHKVPSKSIPSQSMQIDEDVNSDDESEAVETNPKSDDTIEKGDNSNTTSEEYEADDESYDSQMPTLCSYNNRLTQPELWLLTFDLMTSERLTLTAEQQFALLRSLDRKVRDTEHWSHVTHKTELVLRILRYHRDTLQQTSSAHTELILSLVTHISNQDNISSHVLLELFDILKLSAFKEDILRCINSVITSSVTVPTHSVSFPLDRSDKDNVGVMVSTIVKYGNSPVSAVLWIYVDGSISSAYNSSNKAKQPVHLLTLQRSQLSLTLNSEVTTGNVTLLISNGRGSMIGQLPVKAALTTNKWQMISFTADVRSRDNQQISFQFSLGVDGRSVKAGSETFTTPVKISVDESADLDINIGQRSNIYLKENSIHFAHAFIFKGILNELQSAVLYSLGPRYDSFSKCVAHGEHLSAQVRCKMSRQLHITTLEQALKHLSRSVDTPSEQTMHHMILAVIGPKYKPFSLAYRNPPPPKRTRTEEYNCNMDEQSVAFDRELVTVSHTSLEQALSSVGGVNLLLYMFAKAVEMKLDEESQILSLQCLTHASSHQDCTSQTTELLDFRLLSRVLQSEHCMLTQSMTQVLTDHCMRQVIGDILLVDIEFIKHVMLDWTVWETRLACWQHVWTRLCQSVSKENKFRHVNSQALLDHEVLQTAIRIPSEQYQKNTRHALTLPFVRQISQLAYGVLSVTQDRRLTWDICRYLLLLHPAESTYIQYDRRKLYPAHHWAPVKKRSNASQGFLGRLRSDSVCSHLLEESTDGPAFVVVSNDGNISEEGISDQSTDAAMTSDADQVAANSTTDGDTSKEGYSISMNTNSKTSGGDSSVKGTQLLNSSDYSADYPRPVSPTFDDTSCGSDKPDIILSHHEEEETTAEDKLGESVTRTEDTLCLMSSYLLHTLCLSVPELTPSDQYQFYTDFMTLDTLTVFLNHTDINVIYSTLKLLQKTIELSRHELLESFINKRGFHLIASQLNNQPQCSKKVVTVCTQLINGKQCSEMTKAYSMPFLLPLLGVLDKCCHDLHLTTDAFSVLFQVLEERGGSLTYCLQNGLVEVLCNCLAALNKHHPTTDSKQLDQVFAYIHSFLQKIADFLVCEVRTESIKSFLCLFILLERQQRNEQAGLIAIQRVETAIRVIFQELYTSIKLEAKSKTKGLLSRGFERFYSTDNTSTTGLEESGTFSPRRESIQVVPLTASMTSLAPILGSDSKANKSSLTEMLLYTLEQFSHYSLYRVEGCRRDESNLSSVTELLLDALMASEDDYTKKSIWKSIIQLTNVRFNIWKQLSVIFTFVLSPYCDLITAESVFSIISLLPDTNQKRIVENIQVNDFLVPNLKRFVQTHTLKSSTESFLLRLRQKFSSGLRLTNQTTTSGSSSNQSLVSSQAPNINDSEDDLLLMEEWTKWYQARRLEWKQTVHDRKHRAFHSLDSLMKEFSHTAMEINKDITHHQTLERKKFIEQVKISMAAEVIVRKEWQRIIKQFTHERAVWYDETNFPQSWEIDPTEGPGRVRKRLQRCQLRGVETKFLLESDQHKVGLAQSTPPLQYLFEDGQQSESASVAIIFRLHTNETISFTCKCDNVTPSTETHGDLLISDHCIHFVGDDAFRDFQTNEQASTGSHELLSISWPLIEIKSFYKRRYQLQDNALEIFLTNGRACLLSMDSTKERDNLLDVLNKLRLPNLMTSADLNSIQRQWIEGRMSNFDYITHLNTLAGRSFNDLMQYPVFPWILNIYEGNSLDLNNGSSFRKLNKPIACQNPENEEKYKMHYAAIEADIELSKRHPDSSHAPLAPYHYASHYSNSGVVLHYLVRLLPYTQMFLKYQDGSFDIPDRTFHSMHTSWLLSSAKSSTDVKELIPEFFYLPEFMTNYEGFNFGKRHTKEQVEDLNIPEWCLEDSRLFVLILRQALENTHVSTNLHHWINLIYGYQQQGPAAVDAVNKFHPATYFGLEVNSIEDELQKNAIKVMIRTYGQMPKQLFTSQHAERQANVSTSTGSSGESRDAIPVLDTVPGLRWGDYLGSPSDPTAHRLAVNEVIGAHSIVAVTSADIIGLNESTCAITHEVKSGDEVSSHTDRIWVATLTWNNPDSVLRVTMSKDKPPVNFMHVPFQVTVCTSAVGCKYLLIGSESGFIQVHKIQHTRHQTSELSWTGLEATLTGHHSAITSLKISTEYSIIVSADSTGHCIIWDLNKLTYVRSMTSETGNKIDCVTISPTMGDIALCSSHGAGSVVEVYTINARQVCTVTLSDRCHWLCYSAAPEGISVNAIAGALSNATIQLWSSWDMKPLLTLSIAGMNEPFVCCTYTPNNQRLAANTNQGRLVVWERGDLSVISAPAKKLKFFMAGQS